MNTQTTRLEKLGHEFGEAIVDHLKYEAHEEAKTTAETDDDVQELIVKSNQPREEFNVSRQVGGVTQEGLRKVQVTQKELHSEPVMGEYLLTQAEFVDELEKTNEAIPEPFAVDFDGGAGGCCNN